MKKVISIIPLLFCCLNLIGQPNNLNISNGNVFDGEPYIAVNPINHNNIVVAWMGLTFSGTFKVSIKTKSSFDGGITWGNYYVQQHLTATYHSADVSMCFRNDGVLYLSYIDSRQNPDSGGVYVTHSNDGGITWSLPILAFDAYEDGSKLPVDRPWLVIDNSASPNFGTLYLTTKPAPWILPPNRPYLKVSVDSGLTWSAFRYVDTTGYLVGNLIAAPMATPAVTADGALTIAYPSYVVSQSVFPKIYLAKSYNKGAGFQYHDLLINPSAVADTNYKLGYHLAANPANANQLAFTSVGNQNGDPDIYSTTSNDGGLTWNTPVRVNDDAISNGKAQDMVWANYAANGDLAVTWRDRRNATGTGFYQASDTYCAISHDNGLTFQNNIRLSNVTAPFDSVLAENGNDFMSCELIDDSIYAVWSDIRNGKLNIYFAKTATATGQGTGVTEVSSEIASEIILFPNPVKDKMTIQLPFSLDKMLLEIYSADGKMVFCKNSISNFETINCSKFSNGLYMIKIKNGNELYSKQFLIAK